MIEEKKKYYTARYDIVFKSVFAREDSKELMKSFLEKILDIKIERLTFLNNELLVDSIDERKKTVDVLVKTKDNYFHIEVNTETEEYLHNRNFAFFTKIFSSITRRGEEYDLYTEFIHIDLTYNLRKEYKTEEIRNEYNVINKDKVKYVKNFKIIEYDMDLLKSKWYNMTNKEQEEYKYLMMLDLEREELKKLSEKGDKVIMEYEDKVNDLNDSETFESLMTWEEDYEKRMKTNMHLEHDRGLEEGKKETQLSTAKEMLNKNFDIELISEITKLSIAEIEKIKEENIN